MNQKPILTVLVCVLFVGEAMSQEATATPGRRSGLLRTRLGARAAESVATSAPTPASVAQTNPADPSEGGIPGVTAPFIPFPEKDKIKYEEAIERAEKNDARAFYWLAYYFAKGESVDRDGDVALKFLKKAVDANDSIACYTFGLLLENDALQDENGRSVGDRDTNGGFWNMNFTSVRNRHKNLTS